MSTIGKVFLVLNLVLAGAFLGWAANSLGKTEQLKKANAEKVAGLEKEKADLDAQLTSTRGTLNSEKSAKDAAQAERDSFKTEAGRYKEELDSSKRANDQLRGDVAKINETMSGLNERLQQIEQSKDAATAEARKMQGERDAANRRADEADTARRTAEESQQSAQLAIADLEKQLKWSKTELEKAKTQFLNAQALTGLNVSDVKAQKPINAQVVKVDDSIKLVALNVGSNAGVERGYTFDIYSGSTYKGRVRVETVHPDMCSALITLAKEGTKINAGDSAATVL
jgi:chromosome segregation ATPase